MALDTYRPALERLAWVSILTTSVGSLAVNRFPGVSPSAGEQPVVARLLAPSAERWPEPDRTLGRASLYSEVRDTNRLRRIGGFLRDRLPADATLLTLAGRYRLPRLLPRHGPVRPDGRPAGLPARPMVTVPPRARLEAALSKEPEYILPWLNGLDVVVNGDEELPA